MALSVRFRTALVLATSLALAPAAHAERWHDGDRHHNHHGGGNAAGAAIVGGLVGLGLGAAIASGGGYYAPPPVYYGAPGTIMHHRRQFTTATAIDDGQSCHRAECPPPLQKLTWECFR